MDMSLCQSPARSPPLDFISYRKPIVWNYESCHCVIIIREIAKTNNVMKSMNKITLESWPWFVHKWPTRSSQIGLPLLLYHMSKRKLRSHLIQGANSCKFILHKSYSPGKLFPTDAWKELPIWYYDWWHYYHTAEDAWRIKSEGKYLENWNLYTVNVH